MKRTLSAICAAFGLFSAAFLCGSLLASRPDIQSADACYAVLYPYGEYIGVFSSDAAYLNGDLPQSIIQTPIASLPQKDRTALENGIPLQDRETLRQYTEDFGIGMIAR